MDVEDFRRWVDAYQRAWRTPGTALLGELFAPDAVYRHSPYAEPIAGLAAIERDWEAERDGPDEVFTVSAEVLGFDPAGRLGVARLEVRYGDPVSQEYRDLWVVRFDGAGRAVDFEEWPFWPGQGWKP